MSENVATQNARELFAWSLTLPFKSGRDNPHKPRKPPYDPLKKAK